MSNNAFNLENIIKEVKKGAKEIRKNIPKDVGEVAESLYQFKHFQKTLQKQGKKIKDTTLLAVAEQVMKSRGYKVSQEDDEIVAKKGRSKVLVGFLSKKEGWAERMKEASCTKGVVLTVEPVSEEIAKEWKDLKTEVLSSKDLVEWLSS